MTKLIHLEQLKERIKKERDIKLCLEQQIDFLEKIDEYYPYIKIDITEEQLKSINEIIYEEIKKPPQVIDYFDCMGNYISDILYDVVYFNHRLNVNIFKRHIIFLNKYFDLPSLLFIDRQIDQKIEQIPCKIIQFKGK